MSIPLAGGSFGDCYSNRYSGSERPELLESLYFLQRMRRKRDPLCQRFARVRVHSDMLQCPLGELGRIRLVPKERNCSA